MKLGFGEIERALQVIHGIGPDKATAFRARLRYLQQKVDIGLPRGGTGRRANFEPGHLFKLAFAAELLEVGIPPEAVALSVMQHWPDAVEQMFRGRAEWGAGNPERRFLVAEPRALTSNIYRFKKETTKSLADRLRLGRTVIIIDVSGLFDRVARAAQEVGFDMEALNTYLDEHQKIILSEGARVPRPPQSGFIGDE